MIKQWYRWISLAATALVLGGCCGVTKNWKSSFDPPMNHEGREMICLNNLERLLDAKQDWVKETGARPGSLCPSAEVLAHRYFRMYEYGRKAPCDDDTQNLPVFKARCPRGGEYIIGTVGERPKCSVCGDLLRDYDTHIRVPHTH
ncbi:MAG: hypothetical protein K1X53_10840 [Candidatus Sumerlaeaceae bacterium]|nr:hypothetical protein [Candidatus Sumerlaeaceae bacterium]